MTYSIVARDKKTGQMGIAVQTHWFGVGNNVPWLESGVGAIATQAMTNMDYGKKGLELLNTGKTPQEVLGCIGRTDESYEMRQVAIINNDGKISAHTGKNCVKYAGYLLGDGCIVQGNILTNEKVLPAMLDAYENNCEIDFAQRLLVSARAGEEAGGELRGVQSASLRVVSNKKNEYDIVNLRIDDNETPLREIERQLSIQEAYMYMQEAEEQGDFGNINESLKLFQKALNIIPDSKEILFWKAYMLKNNNKGEEAKKILEENFQEESTWLELWNRI